MLAIRGLDHRYGESRTLWDVDLDVAPGSRTCLMGRNGVGKSTLLRCVMGLEPIAGGSMRLREEAIERRPAEARAALRVGYVPQGREIFPRLTVAENLAVGRVALGRDPRTLPDLIFELFPVLAEMLGRRGGDLSGGQQQQLAIGRALAIEPELLILDEPTEGIQPSVVREIGDAILKLNEALGMTVLLVEQKLPFARRVADTFHILDKGRAVASGPMAALDDALVRRHLAV